MSHLITNEKFRLSGLARWEERRGKEGTGGERREREGHDYGGKVRSGGIRS